MALDGLRDGEGLLTTADVAAAGSNSKYSSASISPPAYTIMHLPESIFKTVIALTNIEDLELYCNLAEMMK